MIINSTIFLILSALSKLLVNKVSFNENLLAFLIIILGILFILMNRLFLKLTPARTKGDTFIMWATLGALFVLNMKILDNSPMITFSILLTFANVSLTTFKRSNTLPKGKTN